MRLFFPVMCLMLVVYSDITARWRCCRADQWSDTFCKGERECLVVCESREVLHHEVLGKVLSVKTTVVPHKTMVKIRHTNELLDSDCQELGKLLDGSYLGGQWNCVLFGNVVVKEIYLLPAKLTLGQIDDEIVLL